MFVAFILFDAQMRRLCSGKTLAFQAKDAGSIPHAAPISGNNFPDRRLLFSG